MRRYTTILMYSSQELEILLKMNLNMEKSLKPIEQKQVVLYDDELTAIRADDGQIYVTVGQMCQALGVMCNELYNNCVC
jgi:hypothetical protein